MAISIKNEEANQLARRLAATTGESLTEAILQALRERLAREERRRGHGIGARLERLQQEFAALPVLDRRSPDEILGYDDRGRPT